MNESLNWTCLKCMLKNCRIKSMYKFLSTWRVSVAAIVIAVAFATLLLLLCFFQWKPTLWIHMKYIQLCRALILSCPSLCTWNIHRCVHIKGLRHKYKFRLHASSHCLLNQTRRRMRMCRYKGWIMAKYNCLTLLIY